MLGKLLRICPIVAASLLLLLLLTACAHYVDAPLSLPDIPQPLKDCAAVAIPPIPGEPGTPLTNEQVAVSLAEQRFSALSKDRCVRDSHSWYNDLKNSLGAEGH